MSALMSNNASCNDIASAATKCIASMLPDSSVVALETLPGGSTAKIIASVDAPFVAELQNVPVESPSLLQYALQQPSKCHIRDFDEARDLFPQLGEYSADSDIIIAGKSVARPGHEPMILVTMTTTGLRIPAANALMTICEVLQALCLAHDATNSDEKIQFAIRNAKNEWEATVDALSDLVCLVDGNGRIIRANRTAERWRLSSVVNVRGMSVHDMLHPACQGAGCALASATELRRLHNGSVDSYESVIVDANLERALKIQIQQVTQLPDIADSSHNAMAVIIIADITALHNARGELKALNQTLEQQVRERTDALVQAIQNLKLENDQRKLAELNLKESRDELALLSQQLMRAQEDERSRLSRELHDSVGQSLGAVKYTLERLAAARDQKNPDDPNEILPRAIAGVAEAIRDTRTIAMRLRPPILDDMGAAAAVQWLIRSFSSTYPDVDFHLHASVTNEEIAGQLATHIYRITQESLNNAVKHANADSILVSMKQDSNRLLLEIADDGVGFESEMNDTGQFRKLGHFGHLGMRERAANSNGSLTIRSAPGKGTTVKVEWELAPANRCRSI